MRFVSFPVRLALALVLAPFAAAAELISSPGAGGEPSISGEGRYVAFSSLARLLPADKNSRSDVYLRDRKTGALRLLSDDRGGDQPAISANGRFVAFRALDTFPKIRLVDLDGDATPRTVSYPFNNTSFRYADSPAISPEGDFVAFSFRPVPGFSGEGDPQLCVNNTRESDRLNASTSITFNFVLDTLGRAAMTRDGNTFFLETNDGIAGLDTNGVGDIYLVNRNEDFVRLSATDGGLLEEKAARDPTVTAAGDAVFFISKRRLRAADNDGRATIYRSTSADGFATPEPILTAVQPLALSAQATGDGVFLVFLGQPASGPSRPYILRLSNGGVQALAPSATEPPALSADNGLIAFTNAGAVQVVANPFANARIARPVVTLSGVTEDAVLVENAGVILSATTSAPGSSALFTALEVDGIEVFRSAGGSVQRNVGLTRGRHTIRAVALNAANVPGESASVHVTVVPAANSLVITSLTGLRRTLRGDGFTAFSGALQVDNTFTSARGPLQIILSERPADATWEFFGDESAVEDKAEQVLDYIAADPLAGNTSAVVDLSSVASPPATVGDGFQGRGSLVVARLREQVGGTWFDRDELVLFEILPRLNEDTPGPNGGIPVFGSGTGGPTFNPEVYQALQIAGPAQMAEQTSANFTATAVFNTGNQPCTPDWKVVGGAGVASISPAGVLTAGDVASPHQVTVRASFSGRTETLAVTIQPVSPVVSVLSADKTAEEGGDQGAFKILRSPAGSNQLKVDYRIGGDATPGADFAALAGSVTIPAGRSSAIIRVNALADGFFEGREKVKLTVLSSSRYRRGSVRSAKVVIEDAEPVPAGQPDATVQLRGAAPLGVQKYGFDSGEQQAFAGRVNGQTAIFDVRVVNRTTAAQDFTLEGAGDFLGFTVRYFSGNTNVTAAVLAGTFAVNGVAPGESTRLEVRITPTAATPKGSLIRCPIVAHGASANDVVEAVVQRVK